MMKYASRYCFCYVCRHLLKNCTFYITTYTLEFEKRYVKKIYFYSHLRCKTLKVTINIKYTYFKK